MIVKTNLELKYFCKDFEQIKKILKELGAYKIGVFIQKDYFFKLPFANEEVPSRLKFRVTKNSRKLIFYKREKFSTEKNTKSNIIIHEVHDGSLLNFLKRCFGVLGIVEKRREKWRKGSAVFHLDTINKIGNIFEIEVCIKKENENKEKVIFSNYKNLFLPYLDKIVTGSNIDLILKNK